jgi:hypothetical protein
MSTVPILADEDATAKPFFCASPLGGAGRYACGAIVSSPDLAAWRLILCDGTSFEDRVSNGGLLLFATLHSPAQWADWARLEFLDRQGTVVYEEKHWMHPYELPAEWET